MARQLGERFGIPECFSDLQEMLQATSPDIVHITTPPQSHYSVAKQCLGSGSHVYVEKPFTITTAEAESLIELADRCGLRIMAGHNYQFTLEMLEMRRLVNKGLLRGKPVHLESYWSYDLGDLRYASAFLGDRNHWVRQLPGQLFHNIISHGIAKLAEFLDDELTEIVAMAHQSEQLRSLRTPEVLDELRVLIRDKNGTTAFFCFDQFPIPYREIVLTARIMDEIFAQIYPRGQQETADAEQMLKDKRKDTAFRHPLPVTSYLR